MGRIAVRSDLQRSSRRVGPLLLEHAIYKACEASEIIAGRFIVLDAKTDELCKWYLKMGFRPLKDNVRRMILPIIKDARSMMGGLGEEHFIF